MPKQFIDKNFWSSLLIDDCLLPNTWELTQEICLDLGIRFERNNYFIKNTDQIIYQIYVHDNCFFSIEPTTEFVLTRLIENILLQHSFYLGQDIDWSNVSPIILKHLLSLESLKLQSNRRQKTITIKSNIM